MEGNFETKTYNSVSIIRNTEDGYVNASQMCSSNNKKWRNYKNTQQWKACIEAFRTLTDEGVQKWAPSYYLENVAPKYQGEYIHPKLVHFVAEYCSVEYAFKVAHIMDKINEYSQATGQTFDETKDELIAQMQAKIDEQAQQIEQLETKIAQTSVPEENCDKDLFIIRDANNQLKLSADNTHPPRHFIRRYRFPAAMNVRQLVREQFEMNGCSIPNDRLEEVMAFINGLNPKERE